MIFQQIDFHNAVEMIPTEHGFRPARIPAPVRQTLNEAAREQALSSTGVELRLKIRSGEADLILYAETASAVPAFLYFGYFQSGWTMNAFAIREGENRIHLSYPGDMEGLTAVAEAEKHPFSPWVIRLVLPPARICFVGAEGDIVPPEKGETPEKTLLCHGSSITHGSLSLGPGHSYVFQLGRQMGLDTLNLGLAGAAHLEKSLAEYIVSRQDWHFATFEMGVNMLNRFTNAEFEARLSDFLSVLRRDARPKFITSLFATLKKSPQAQDFREIVRKYQGEPFIFTEGEALLHELSLITADQVHPSLEGQALIARRWGSVISRQLHIESRF